MRAPRAQRWSTTATQHADHGRNSATRALTISQNANNGPIVRKENASMSRSQLEITFACSDNDRTRAIVDGRVAIESCDVTCLVLEPAEMFARACRYAEFDVTELSFSSYMRMVDMGDSPYVAVPAFLSRAFRHSSFYIRTDRGLRP